MKKNLLVVLSVLVAAALAVAAYFLFFRNTATVTMTPSGTATLPSSGSATPGTSGTQSAPSAGPTQVAARLVRISAGPVVPGILVSDRASATTTDPGDTVVNYIERQSGNVFSYSAANGAVTRTNNTTLPGIERAYWLPSGTTAFVQYLSGTDSATVDTYALSASGGSGFFLPKNLSGLAVASSSIASCVSGVTGSSVSTYRTDGSGSTLLFSTPLSALTFMFAGPDHFVIFTKPSASLSGYAYFVDKKGVFSKLAGPRDGLAALPSPDGSKTLVSFSRNGALGLELVDTKTRAETALPVATLADKCAWTEDSLAVYCGVPVQAPRGKAYPDDWYQGLWAPSDRIWKIDIAGRYAELVVDLTKTGDGAFDTESLSVDPAGHLLSFINKNDGSLWAYSL